MTGEQIDEMLNKIPVRWTGGGNAVYEHILADGQIVDRAALRVTLRRAAGLSDWEKRP